MVVSRFLVFVFLLSASCVSNLSLSLSLSIISIASSPMFFVIYVLVFLSLPNCMPFSLFSGVIRKKIRIEIPRIYIS